MLMAKCCHAALCCADMLRHAVLRCAVQFSQESKAGRMLMAKCRALQVGEETGAGVVLIGVLYPKSFTLTFLHSHYG